MSNTNTDEKTTVASAESTGSAHCVRYGCQRMPLKLMRAGQSHQTVNGFFSIAISGYYCPRCGAGYGGGNDL